MINRSAIIVKPKQPYLEWAKQDDAEGLAESVFESLRTEPHVYLLPEYEDPTSQQEVLEEFWPTLFEGRPRFWIERERRRWRSRSLKIRGAQISRPSARLRCQGLSTKP